MQFSSIILMSPAGEEGGNYSWIMLVVIMVIFYFFMIRPQMKKAKDQKKYREGLAKGDKVITIGGVHGKIVEMDETTVILEMIDKARVKVEKSAISMESTMSVASRESRQNDNQA